jgi:hypothetical protein
MIARFAPTVFRIRTYAAATSSPAPGINLSSSFPVNCIYPALAFFQRPSAFILPLTSESVRVSVLLFSWKAGVAK